MSDPTRRDVLADFGKATGRPVRWAIDGAAQGDFEDRANTIEVFDVQDFEQRALFSALRPLRERARELLGRSIRVLFHTIPATTRYYAEVRPLSYQVPWPRGPASARPRRLAGIIDDDVLGDPRPPRSKVA